MGGLSKLFGNNDNAVASPGEAAAKADMYICVNASTIELVDIEKYVAEYVGDKPIVLWNLELDTLRADLGDTQLVCFVCLCIKATCNLADVSHLCQGGPMQLLAMSFSLVNFLSLQSACLH